jgi:hypothetical protein
MKGDGVEVDLDDVRLRCGVDRQQRETGSRLWSIDRPISGPGHRIHDDAVDRELGWRLKPDAAEGAAARNIGRDEGDIGRDPSGD